VPIIVFHEAEERVERSAVVDGAGDECHFVDVGVEWVYMAVIIDLARRLEADEVFGLRMRLMREEWFIISSWEARSLNGGGSPCLQLPSAL
jgi:hypothetical protein